MENNMRKGIILTIILMTLIFGILSSVSALTIKNVASTPNEVAPGQVVSISLDLKNNFDYDLANVIVKIDLTNAPFAPYQSSSEKYQDEIQDDDSESFNFELVALPETASGIYKIPVVITYVDDNDDTQTKTETISLVVNSKPELQVSVDDGTLIKGQENELNIKLVNSGLADVKFLYVNPSDNGGLRFTSEKEQYLGNIDSNDFDSVKYRVYINPSASNLISLPVVLKYRDATNKEFTETQTIFIKTYSLSEAQDLGLVAKSRTGLYVGIIIVILGYWFYRRWKKKRKLKKRGSEY